MPSLPTSRFYGDTFTKFEQIFHTTTGGRFFFYSLLAVCLVNVLHQVLFISNWKIGSNGARKFFAVLDILLTQATLPASGFFLLAHSIFPFSSRSLLLSICVSSLLLSITPIVFYFDPIDFSSRQWICKIFDCDKQRYIDTSLGNIISFAISIILCLFGTAMVVYCRKRNKKKTNLGLTLLSHGNDDEFPDIPERLEGDIYSIYSDDQSLFTVLTANSLERWNPEESDLNSRARRVFKWFLITLCAFGFVGCIYFLYFDGRFNSFQYHSDVHSSFRKFVLLFFIFFSLFKFGLKQLARMVDCHQPSDSILSCEIIIELIASNIYYICLRETMLSHCESWQDFLFFQGLHISLEICDCLIRASETYWERLAEIQEYVEGSGISTLLPYILDPSELWQWRRRISIDSSVRYFVSICSFILFVNKYLVNRFLLCDEPDFDLFFDCSHETTLTLYFMATTFASEAAVYILISYFFIRWKIGTFHLRFSQLVAKTPILLIQVVSFTSYFGLAFWEIIQRN